MMFMKKISLLLVVLLAIFSCEQEDLEGVVRSDAEPVQTRTATSIADFDPIAELNGIVVNILNVGNTSLRYLSCAKSGNKVDLYNKDDGSLRQRWYISFNSHIISMGGHSISIPPLFPPSFVEVAPNASTGETYPQLALGNYLNYVNEFELSDDGNCYICSMSDSKSYLQSDTRTGSDLKYKYNRSTDLAQWKFTPVGDYEIVDLEYVCTSVDNLNPVEVVCDYDTYDNPSSSVVTWNYTVTTKYTETSNFSNTEGVSVSYTNSRTVGLPNVEGGGSVTTNTTFQQQANKSWTFGTSDYKEVTKTRTGSVPVQPHKAINLEAVVVLYKGSLTYVATLRKVGDTRTFKVKGKWDGTCYSRFYAKTYDAVTGNVLNVYALEE